MLDNIIESDNKEELSILPIKSSSLNGLTRKKIFLISFLIVFFYITIFIVLANVFSVDSTGKAVMYSISSVTGFILFFVIVFFLVIRQFHIIKVNSEGIFQLYINNGGVFFDYKVSNINFVKKAKSNDGAVIIISTYFGSGHKTDTISFNNYATTLEEKDTIASLIITYCYRLFPEHTNVQLPSEIQTTDEGTKIS